MAPLPLMPDSARPASPLSTIRPLVDVLSEFPQKELSKHVLLLHREFGHRAAVSRSSFRNNAVISSPIGAEHMPVFESKSHVWGSIGTVPSQMGLSSSSPIILKGFSAVPLSPLMSRAS